MTDSFREAMGRKVLSRDSADELGRVSHLVIDASVGRVSGLVVGTGRKAGIVDWDEVTGFGPDAVLINDEDAVRSPADERETAAAQGKLELVGKRALSETGNELGQVTDVEFDTDTGRLETIVVGDQEHPASALLGAGSYAAVLAGKQPSGV